MFIRKLPFKKLKLRTFGDLAATLKECIMANANRSSIMNIICAVYSSKTQLTTVRGQHVDMKKVSQYQSVT